MAKPKTVRNAYYLASIPWLLLALVAVTPYEDNPNYPHADDDMCRPVWAVTRAVDIVIDPIGDFFLDDFDAPFVETVSTGEGCK